MRLPAPEGPTTVRLSATAPGFGGTLQLPASPPCAANPPLATHTLKSRDELPAIGPPASRVSASRQGMTGVYAISGAGLPVLMRFVFDVAVRVRPNRRGWRPARSTSRRDSRKRGGRHAASTAQRAVPPRSGHRVPLARQRHLLEAIDDPVDDARTIAIDREPRTLPGGEVGGSRGPSGRRSEAATNAPASARDDALRSCWKRIVDPQENASTGRRRTSCCGTTGRFSASDIFMECGYTPPARNTLRRPAR